MQFSDLVGREELKKLFIQLEKDKKLPHAFLLLAKEGMGGLPFALALAQYLQCENKTNNDSCGICHSCIGAKKLQHPDIHFVFPVFNKEPNKKLTTADFILPFRKFVEEQPYGNIRDWFDAAGAENKKPNISSQEAHDLIKKLYLTSLTNSYKVALIWLPEYLGKEGNVLLKLIEEPPKNTIMIFVAEQQDHLLMTIQSRLQLFVLKPFTKNEIQQALEKLNIDAQQQLLISRIAEGNWRKAIQFLSNSDNNELVLFKNLLNALFTQNGILLGKWLKEMNDVNKENIKQFLLYFQQLIEFALRRMNNFSLEDNLLNDEIAIVEKLISKNLNAKKVELINEKINETLYAIERNANMKILLHSFSLHCQDALLAK